MTDDLVIETISTKMNIKISPANLDRTYRIGKKRLAESTEINYSKTYRRNRAEVFCKKGVLRNLQENSQENTCARVSFLAQVFSYELGEISKNTFFYRTPLVAASKRSSYNVRKNVFFPTKKSERMQCKYNRKLNAKTHGNFKERKDRTPVHQRMDI